MFSFNFMGKDSYEDFGIVVEKRPIIPKPQRNIQYLDVPGRSGSLKVDDATYKDIIIPISCGFRDKNVADMADIVKTWLDSGEGPLILSNQTDKYYLAHVSDQLDISQELRVFGQFLVNFRCKPFKYAVNNGVVTLVTPGAVINMSSMDSRPVIKIYGAGAIDLTINNATFHLTNVIDYVTVDSVLMDAYKDTQLMNNNMIGEFPKLQVGTNTISWVGSVSKIELTPNWMWL